MPASFVAELSPDGTNADFEGETPGELPKALQSESVWRIDPTIPSIDGWCEVDSKRREGNVRRRMCSGRQHLSSSQPSKVMGASSSPELEPSCSAAFASYTTPQQIVQSPPPVPQQPQQPMVGVRGEEEEQAVIDEEEGEQIQWLIGARRMIDAAGSMDRVSVMALGDFEGETEADLTIRKGEMLWVYPDAQAPETWAICERKGDGDGDGQQQRGLYPRLL